MLRLIHRLEICFSFFSDLNTIASDALKKKCQHLANMYHKDLNYDDLLNECEHLKHYMALDQNCKTLPALYRKIISDNLKSVFPNIEIALRVFMCMMENRRTFFFKTETHQKCAS